MNVNLFYEIRITTTSAKEKRSSGFGKTAPLEFPKDFASVTISPNNLNVQAYNLAG